YATSNGSAVAGTNYTAASGDLSFGPGVTSRTFTVSVRDDLVVTPTQTVNLTLSSPGGGASLGTANATLQILDVDGPGTLEFSSPAFSVVENQWSATITVSRVQGKHGQVSVHYATSDGTAHAGSDYTSASGTLVFNSGETTQTFTVSASND